MTDINSLSVWAGVITALAFAVNIIVQLTKELVPVPTKLWTLVVSGAVVAGSFASAVSAGIFPLTATSVVPALTGVFIVAYIAMYGFDTFRELWERFKKGDDTDE